MLALRHVMLAQVIVRQNVWEVVILLVIHIVIRVVTLIVLQLVIQTAQILVRISVLLSVQLLAKTDVQTPILEEIDHIPTTSKIYHKFTLGVYE